MKSKFLAPISLLRLKSQLDEHKPVAVLTISTTGLDGRQSYPTSESADSAKPIAASFEEHTPIRVFIQQYEYDADSNSYTASDKKLDSLIEASDEAIRAAELNADTKNGFDAFVDNGIDKKSYLAHENVIDKESFKARFNEFVEGLSQDVLLIGNGDYSFFEKYMSKIECASYISERYEAKKYICQRDLTSNYMLQHKIDSKASAIENMLTYISPDKSTAFLTLAGADMKAKAMFAFISKFGEEASSLSGKSESILEEIKSTEKERYKKMGRKNIDNQKYNDNIDFLVNTIDTDTGKPIVDISKVLNADDSCDITKLNNLMTGKSAKAGVIICTVSTTGIEPDLELPQRVGEAFQVCLTVLDIGKEGFIIPDAKNKDKNLSLNIALPRMSHGLDNAVRNAKTLRTIRESGMDADGQTTKLVDVFAEAGMAMNDYLDGEEKLRLHSEDSARELLTDFFRKNNPKDYILLGSFRQKDGKVLEQHALLSLAFAVADAESIDFEQYIKEYSCLVAFSDAYQKNVIFDIDKYNQDGFGLKDIKDYLNTVNNNSIKSFSAPVRKNIIKLIMPAVYAQTQSVSSKQQEAPSEPVKNTVQENEKTDEIDKMLSDTVRNNQPSLAKQPQEEEQLSEETSAPTDDMAENPVPADNTEEKAAEQKPSSQKEEAPETQSESPKETETAADYGKLLDSADEFPAQTSEDIIESATNRFEAGGGHGLKNPKHHPAYQNTGIEETDDTEQAASESDEQPAETAENVAETKSKEDIFSDFSQSLNGTHEQSSDEHENVQEEQTKDVTSEEAPEESVQPPVESASEPVDDESDKSAEVAENVNEPETVSNEPAEPSIPEPVSSSPAENTEQLKAPLSDEQRDGALKRELFADSTRDELAVALLECLKVTAELNKARQNDIDKIKSLEKELEIYKDRESRRNDCLIELADTMARNASEQIRADRENAKSQTEAITAFSSVMEHLNQNLSDHAKALQQFAVLMESFEDTIVMTAERNKLRNKLETK